MSPKASELIDKARQARRDHRLDDAHRDLSEAVKLCRRSGPPGELIQALKALGQIDRDLGHEDAAFPLYEEAVALCRQEEDALLLAHTIRHLGDIHREAGRLAEAAPCYLEALAIYRANSQTNSLDLANAIRPLAILKDSLGERDEARKLWEEARKLYAEVGIQAGVDECARRLAK